MKFDDTGWVSLNEWIKKGCLMSKQLRGAVMWTMHFISWFSERPTAACSLGSCPGTVQMRGQSRGGTGGIVAHSSP